MTSLQKEDRHSAQRTARGNRKDSPTTLMISVGGVCPGARAHWQEGDTEEERKCTSSRGGGRGRVGELSWGCGMESEKGVWAGLFFCRVEGGRGGGVMINGGEDWDDKLS